MVDNPVKNCGRDPIAEFSRANPACKDELDLPRADLLVELHCQEEFPFVRGAQVQLGGQTSAPEETLDALDFARGQAEDLRRELCSHDLTNSNRLPVKIFAVMRNGFEGMADGMAEVQDGPQAALGLVLPNYIGFDLAAAGHEGRQCARVATQQLWQVTLQTRKQPGVINDAVFRSEEHT